MSTRPHTLRRELRHARQLRRLPWSVAQFQWRARRLATRTGDAFSLASATRPEKLAVLLGAAGGRRSVVELGTATGWTAISLLLADPQRRVCTYDPVNRPERQRYLDLVPVSVSARLRFVAAPGLTGPRTPEPVDLLYIDSSHDRAETVAEVQAWHKVLGTGASIVFDDFDHPDFSGVRDAIEELGLSGHVEGALFIHRVAQPQR